MPSSRRSASVDWGDTSNKRPLFLQVKDLDTENDEELSPLVDSPPDTAHKTQSLNLDKAPGWENFAKEFQARHESMRRSKQHSPGWDRSKNLSDISADCGLQDEIWTDSDDENPSPMGSPVVETVMINMARIGANDKRRTPPPAKKHSSQKYEIEFDDPAGPESPLPGVPTMQSPKRTFGQTQRRPLRPRSKSVDGLAMCDHEPWLRCTEPAMYKDEEQEYESQHEPDILSLMAKKVHRFRGTFKLVGECLGFSSAILAALIMIRVAVFVEDELHKWTAGSDSESSQNNYNCGQALMAYRVYYMLGLSLSLLLALLCSLVVVALIRNLCIMDTGVAIRTIVDELGFLENTDESAYKLCSGLKWGAKVTLVLILFLGAYESKNDSFLHGHACDQQQDVVGDMTWWFATAFAIRMVSTGWDVGVTCLPFTYIKHCYPELYSSQLNTEETHSVLGNF